MISVSPVSDGPFGQVLRYGGSDEPVNALIHELWSTSRPSIHELPTIVDAEWITLWTRLSAAHREHLDPRQVRCRGGAQVGVAVVADAPDPGDRLAQFVVGRLTPDDCPQVVAIG